MLITTFANYCRLCLMLLCASLGVMPSMLMADQVPNLYDVAVPVSSQSNTNLLNASRQGLKTVFIRISGDASAGNNQQVAAAIRDASRYVKQFRYEQQVDVATDEKQLYAVLEFEQSLIDNKLREAGLPLWSSKRPSILLWLVVEDQHGRRFAQQESDALLIDRLQRNAQRRGLLLKLPFFDLQDMAALSVEDVRRLNSSAAFRAAQRYGVDTVLMGRVSQLTNGKWAGNWLYQFDQRNYSLDSEIGELDQQVAAVIDPIADMLAEKYAIAPVDIADGGILMRLTGINNFIDYARAVTYLESVAAVRHANVINIYNDEVVLQLVADGFLPQLQEAFALDRKLLPPVSLYQGAYPVVLDYAWPTTQLGAGENTL